MNDAKGKLTSIGGVVEDVLNIILGNGLNIKEQNEVVNTIVDKLTDIRSEKLRQNKVMMDEINGESNEYVEGIEMLPTVKHLFEDAPKPMVRTR